MTATQTDAIEQAAADAAPQVEFGGSAAALESEPPIGEVLGVVVAMMVLAITFGSLLAAGLPLLTALIGVGAGMLGIQLASGITGLTSTSLTLAAMLGLAVGIDYALFILSRHRTQVRRGHGHGQVDRAVRRHGRQRRRVRRRDRDDRPRRARDDRHAVPRPDGHRRRGHDRRSPSSPASRSSRRCSRSAARASRAARRSAATIADKTTLGARWVAIVMRRPVIAAGLVVVALGALAIPALNVRLGLPNDGSSNPDTTQRQAYDLVSKGFGVGVNGQLTVVARGDAEATAKTLATLPDVAAVSPVQAIPGQNLALISVTPSSGPSSEATENLVKTIRDTRFDSEVLVTGQTATNIDVSQKMADSLIPYLAVVVGLALLLLTIAFRSILVPLTAIGGFLLTIVASFGAVVLVFQEGFGADLIGVSQTGPLVSLLPILIIGVIFGLAMDYQVFLVSRMHEEYAHGASAHDAVRDGFRHSARVVTAAALIMISVFAGFILPDDPIIKSIGFAFAVGIAIDAFLIRMTLIPALMTLLGARAWWLPRPLQRVVPNLDLEGAALART